VANDRERRGEPLKLLVVDVVEKGQSITDTSVAYREDQPTAVQVLSGLRQAVPRAVCG
jgi:hypothetical protein